MHLRGDQPPGLPLVLTTGHRRLRALRAGPAAASPLAGGTGLRPVLPRGPAAPGAVRALRAAAPAGRPARPAPLTPALTAPGSRSPTPAADCGTEDKLYEKGRCARCSLRRRARELLSAGTGIIPAQLNGVFDAVTAARQPRSALNWLRKGAGAGLLADVAAGRLAISHEALDAHPHRRAADYLRHMLTAAGALPARDEELARAGQWLTVVLGGDRAGRRPAAGAGLRHLAGDAPAARQRRSRRPAAHPHRARPQQHPRRREPARLAPRPRHHDSPPAGRPTSTNGCAPGRRHAWPGTSWPGPPSRGHCQRLSIPAPPRATGPAISQDQRWTLTARLLHDTTLDPTDRVAGCLLLLYGQPLSRIAAMTTSQVTRRDDQTSHPARPPRRARPRPARQRRPPADQRRPQLPGRRIPARHHLAVPRAPARPPDHPGQARRTPAGHRHLRPDRAPRRAARPRRPTPRRGPRRPPRPARDNRRQVDAPGRRRLVPLCSRASPPSSPDLTNTSPTPALNQRYSAWSVIRSLPVSTPASTPPSSRFGWATSTSRTTTIYIHADLALKERALDRTTPTRSARPLPAARQAARIPRQPVIMPTVPQPGTITAAMISPPFGIRAGSAQRLSSI